MDPNSPFVQNEFARNQNQSSNAANGRRQQPADRSVRAAAEAERDVHRRRSRARTGRADAPGQPGERHDLHDRPARAGRRGRHRRAGRSDRSGTSTCASRRTACACSPRKPAALPSSTRTTSTRRSSGSTPRRATTTCSGTTRTIPTRRKRRRQVEVKVARKGAQRVVRGRNTCSSRPPAARLVDEEVAFAFAQPSAAARAAASRTRSTASFEVRLVQLRPDEVHAEPRARDGRAAQPRERIHRQFESARGRAGAGTARAGATGTSPDADGRGRAAGSSRTG